MLLPVGLTGLFVFIQFKLLKKCRMSPAITNLIPAKTHRITLYVNTKYLKNKRDANKYAYANFGQDPRISNKDYTVLVNLNDDIEWVGVSSSDPDTDQVYITKIKYENKEKLLNCDDIDGEIVVKAKVTKGKGGDEEKYTLHFKIVSPANPQNGSFNIDPILRIN